MGVLFSNDFNMFIDRYGTNVTIIHKIPKLDKDGKKAKDAKGHMLFDSEDVDVVAKVNFSEPSNQLWNNLDREAYDGSASFKLKDGQYLNKNSLIKIYDPDIGSTSYFTMTSPKKYKTHYKVGIRNRDV